MLHENLIWFKHASFLYDGSKKIYFDPWEIDDAKGKADYILITHAHYDHFSPETIGVLSSPETVVVAPQDVAEKITGEVKALSPGETLDLDGISIRGVAAYNTDKSFHPKEAGWLGYVVTIDNKKIYHAGDTDRIDEMNNIETDIALLPIGGTYTMNVEEAVKAAQTINPDLAIPMHFGYIAGSQKNGKEFTEAVGEKAEMLIPEIPFER